MDEKITEREKDLLAYVTRFKEVNGYAPTIKEIAVGINTKSTDHVRNMIDDLCSKGYLDMKPKSPRTLVVKKFIS